jgi:hypothetical protein
VLAAAIWSFFGVSFFLTVIFFFGVDWGSTTSNGSVWTRHKAVEVDTWIAIGSLEQWPDLYISFIKHNQQYMTKIILKKIDKQLPARSTNSSKSCGSWPLTFLGTWSRRWFLPFLVCSFVHCLIVWEYHLGWSHWCMMVSILQLAACFFFFGGPLHISNHISKREKILMDRYITKD